jgi:cell division protein YceG involved in septum cleavage
MKKFTESVKDFMYDAIDYILILVVIAVVAGIIGWRLDILFAKDTNVNTTSKNKIETSKQSNNSNDSKDNTNVSQSDKNNNSENSSSSAQKINVVIPEGALCPKIADILLQKGVIKDKKEFLAKASELKLDTKLKSGEYQLSPSSSLEDILKTLSK